jgi:hypothetical protein
MEMYSLDMTSLAQSRRMGWVFIKGNSKTFYYFGSILVLQFDNKSI